LRQSGPHGSWKTKQILSLLHVWPEVGLVVPRERIWYFSQEPRPNMKLTYTPSLPGAFGECVCQDKGWRPWGKSCKIARRRETLSMTSATEVISVLQITSWLDGIRIRTIFFWKKYQASGWWEAQPSMYCWSILTHVLTFFQMYLFIESNFGNMPLTTHTDCRIFWVYESLPRFVFCCCWWARLLMPQAGRTINTIVLVILEQYQAKKIRSESPIVGVPNWGLTMGHDQLLAVLSVTSSN